MRRFGGACVTPQCGLYADHSTRCESGAARWSIAVHGFAQVSPASLVGGLLYVNATQAQALRPDTGAAAWRFPAQESQIDGVGLLVIGGTAYVGLADGTTHALGALDGAPRWIAAVGVPLAAGA
ncbi:MAG TPA: PQQ-binding-like beta-propeller repeat protein [Ktedonobacterales bacterium]|nr:PQQ-binding-like beta-propeller repeat protein [Ktedonobacterales bacterium]